MNEKLIAILRAICEDTDGACAAYSHSKSAYVHIVTEDNINEAKELLAEIDQTYEVVKCFSGDTPQEVTHTGLTKDEAKDIVGGDDTSGTLPTGEKWMLIFRAE
jgi:hypothetical protein